MQKDGLKTILEHLENPSDLATWNEKPIISYQKILWPNHLDVGQMAKKKNAAFLGLTDCDARALNIFLEQFSHTDILPSRSEILIMTAECKPESSCFCQAIGYKNFESADLHVQEEGRNFQIFALTKTGEKILRKCGIEKLDRNISIRPIKEQSAKKMDLAKISDTINDKAGHLEYWQKIAGECFTCGACTAVCPLCFCFRQNIENKTDGSCTQCLKADSCYSTSFSELSSHHNIRPTSADRMYNWYHHKFCRSQKKHGYPLCTGCGRCVDACPAYLNQHGVASGILNEEINHE